MITEFATKIGFPEEAISHLENCHTQLIKDPELYAELYHAIDLFFLNSDRACYTDLINSIAEKSDIHKYTVEMIMLLLAARPLHYIYRRNGVSDEIFYDTMTDLRCKLWECKNVYGIWGTFVGFWYHKPVFSFNLFKLGRLEYERRTFPYKEYKGILKEGDVMYSCHIPSAGPVTPESVMDSLKKAYGFFRPELKDGILPVFCSSWMLCADHYEKVYHEGSNLKAFYEMFDVFESSTSESNGNFWRIFNMEFSRDTLPDAPEDTTLRRNFKKYLLDGNNMGSGKGILLFDGERIINK